MAFKKSNNIGKLETAVAEKTNKLHIDSNSDRKEIPVKNVEEVKKVAEKPLKQPVVENNQAGVMIKLLELKNRSKDMQHKKVETLSLRVGTETYEKVKELAEFGIVSQSDLFTALIEEAYDKFKGDN